MDYDLALHNSRVLNDGGSVPNPIQAESYIKYLKENNLWDSCVFFGLGGSKIEPNTDNSCRTLYDLKGNADVFNTTASAQPRYNQDGSLLYDGGDCMVSNAFAVDNPIRNCLTNITIICWVKLGSLANQSILCRNANTQATRSFMIYTDASGNVTVGLYSSTTAQKVFTTTGFNFVANSMNQIAITFNGNLTDGGIQGLAKVYVNGVENAVTKTFNQTVPSLQNVDVRIEYGSAYNGLANRLTANSQTALPQIYNSTLTAGQILQNFNNIKPTDISETYGLLTGNHINRVETSFGSIPVVDKVQSTIDKLKSANLWDSCVFFADARIGVKKDSNQYVNAVYDLKTNADLLQATGTAQPKYDIDGSLLYDGSDYLTSNLLNIDNKIRLIDKTITVLTWVYFASGSVEQSIMARWGLGNNHPTCLWLLEITATNRLGVVIDDGTKFVKQFASSNQITAGWHRIGFTYNCDSMDGSVNGLLNLLVDNSVVPVTKTTNLSNTSIRSTDRRLQIGGINDSAIIPIKNTNKTALHQIYNSILADEQLTWNFNNIRPEGV